MNDIVFVYIHGAGLGAYIWQSMENKLQTPAYFAEAPGRMQADTKSLSFDSYIDHLLQQIKTLPQPRIVLVGHSLGGVLALQIADRIRDRLAGIIIIGGMVPESGKNFLSCLPLPQRIIMRLVLKLAGTKVPESAIRKSLCHDLNSEQTEQVVTNFTTESPALYLSSISYAQITVPRLYIVLTQDKDFPPVTQNKMANRLGAKTVTLDAGHLAMMSQPKALAEIIHSFSEQL